MPPPFHLIYLSKSPIISILSRSGTGGSSPQLNFQPHFIPSSLSLLQIKYTGLLLFVFSNIPKPFLLSLSLEWTLHGSSFSNFRFSLYFSHLSESFLIAIEKCRPFFFHLIHHCSLTNSLSVYHNLKLYFCFLISILWLLSYCNPHKCRTYILPKNNITLVLIPLDGTWYSNKYLIDKCTFLLAAINICQFHQLSSLRCLITNFRFTWERVLSSLLSICMVKGGNSHKGDMTLL